MYQILKIITIEQLQFNGYSNRMESIKSEKPRLLALDLDDTLLRSDLSISGRTRSAIMQTEASGLTVALVSGRNPESIEPVTRMLDLHRRPGYIISNNGALITESNTDKIVHESLLSKETILAICDLADAEGFPVQMYADNINYISRKNEYSTIDEKHTGLRQVVVENFRDMAGESCYRLIIPGDPELLAFVENLIKSYLEDKISIFIRRKYFLQIMPKNTNKGTSLAKLAGLLGYDASEVMAVGNSMNDEPMIRWAGISVAMANADERLKGIARHVTTKTNDEDGLAELLEDFFN